ncbi:TPA: DUF975 family protein [Clostridium perfringens]|nr:DUF975 family protein [Clostridium perfringens]
MNRKEIKSIAKSKLKGRWFNIVLLTLIIAIIEFGASEIIGRTAGITSNILNIANNFLLMPAITASGIIYTIKFVKSNEVVALNYAIPSVKTWGRFIMSMIVTMIFSIPILLVVFLGNIFLVLSITSLHSEMLTGQISMNPMIGVWGVVFLIVILVLILAAIVGILLFPLPYLMAEDTCGIWEAVKRSFKIMNGHKWELFIMGLSFLGWLILSVLTLGIGLLWLLPYIQVTLRIYYLSITGRESEIN